MTTSPDMIESSTEPLSVEKVRTEFPILSRKINGKPLIYLDSAASAQRPLAVIEATEQFYRNHNANIHRGVHGLSVEATDLYEGARNTIRKFINARDNKEIIFTRGATESINIVAQCYGRAFLKPGDEVILSTLEHHSNIVPWQMLRDEIGIILKIIPINDRGELLLDQYQSLLSDKTKLVAVQHVSNALGTINPLKVIVDLAHDAGAMVSVDGAQAAPHLTLDMQDIGCDFYAVSGHKMYGPTGCGVLYGKEQLLESMPPWLGGGDMIKSVTFKKTIYADLPAKFEAGTPNIAGVIGLGAAAKYLEATGLGAIAQHEHNILEYATSRLQEVPGITLIGTAQHKAAVISFIMEGVHPHDIGTVLDTEGIAIRTGHHCTQPLMEHFGIPATARASFAMYSTQDEVDHLIKALIKVNTLFT